MTTITDERARGLQEWTMILPSEIRAAVDAVLDAYPALVDEVGRLRAASEANHLAKVEAYAERDALKSDVLSALGNEVEHEGPRLAALRVKGERDALEANYATLQERYLTVCEKRDGLEADLLEQRPLAEACEGLLAFIRERFPKDFEPGGQGYTCPHHKAIAEALRQKKGA